ncbi:MAG: response regulator [Elusimicrobia bacterium]|nr:response regulator [Elusimicrobiota bacterium]
MKILLVEDSDVDARLIEAMLAGLPARPASSRASSLRSALELARTGAFDAVLLDLTLDDSLGLDTLGAFTKEFPSLPVVVVSGEQDEVIRDAALTAGARDFLRKKGLAREDLDRALKAYG